MALAVGVHRPAPPPPPSPAPPAAEAGGWSPAPPAEAPLSGTFWATPPVPAAAFDVPEADRYAEGPLLGRGGMGEVRAVSDRRLQREVAEKSLLYPSVEGEARLEREARVTARLEHPGVVPIYDAGRDAQGRLCYRMRKVAGRSLYAAIRAAPDEAARLRLLRPLLDACRAVAYAHARGVVHRDLKPENILLGEFGEALVTDWGLAWDPADAPAHGSETPRLTAQGVVLGTPGYMSPEQAAGQPPRPQDDVWALGQSLLDLLGEAGPPELRAVASQAQAPLAARYADAGALAAELEAWFEGRRVAAYRYNTAELLRRGLARWRAATGVALISVALIVFGSLWSMQRLDAAADRARRAEAEANLARAAADRHLSAALAQQARDAALAGQRPEAEVLAAHALRLGAAAAEARGVLAMYAHVGRPARLASAALPAGCAPLALSASGASALLQCEGELRLIDGAGAPRWSRPLAAVSARFLSEEYVVVVDVGGHLIIAGRDGGLTVRTHVGEDLDGLYGDPAGQWAVAHNQRFRHRATADRAEALQPLPAPCLAALLLPTGELLSLLGDGTLEIGPLTGPPTERRGLSAEVGPLGGARLLAADPAGQRIAIGTWDGELIVLDRAGGAPARRLAMGVGPAVDLAVSPEGDRVAFVGQQGRARVYDGSAAQLLPALPAGGHGRVAFDGPDTLVLLGAALERWSLPHDSAPSRLEMGGGVTSARFVPSGDGLVAVGSFGRVARWSLADGRRAFSRDLSPDYVIKDLALLDGGRAIYVPSQFPGQPTLLEAETGAPRAAQPAPAQLQRRVAPFGGGLVGYGWGMGPVFFDPLTGRRDEGHQLAHALPLDLGAAPEGDVAALLLRNGDLMLISAADGGVPRLHSQDPAALAVDVARGGAVIALGRPDRLRLIVEGAERSVALPNGASLIDLALDPAGARVALGLRDGRALVYRVEDGVLEAILDAHTERVATVDWSPDGRLLATGSWDDTVRIWGVEPLGQVLAGGGPEARLAEARVAEARVAELEAAWGLQLEAALAEAR